MSSTAVAVTLAAGALACLVLAFFPFGPYQLTLLALRRWRPDPIRPDRDGQPAPADEEPTFAILLCAYNEEAVIRDKVENMLAMRAAAGQLDIFVYVDCASDRTAEILAEYGDQITLVDSPERHGKPWGMNHLVSLTDADIVLFTDANVMVDEHCIERLRPYFEDPDVGCVTSHLTYTNPDDTATSQVGSAYWRLDDWTKRLESDTGSAMGADGSLFAIRRELHRPSPDHLIDDLFVSMSVLCQGHRLVIGPDIRAYEPHATSASEEFGRKVRIACQCIGVHRSLRSEIGSLSRLNRYKWFAHRYLRWVGGYLLAAAVVLTVAALAVGFSPLTALLVVVAGGLVMGIGTILGVGPVAQVNNILIAFAGNAKGVWRAYWGEPVVTWEVADTARREATAPPAVEGSR